MVQQDLTRSRVGYRPRSKLLLLLLLLLLPLLPSGTPLTIFNVGRLGPALDHFPEGLVDLAQGRAGRLVGFTNIVGLRLIVAGLVSTSIRLRSTQGRTREVLRPQSLPAVLAA